MSQSDGLLDAALDDIAELSERVDDLEGLQQELAALRDRVERLEERTDMLRLVEESDQLDAQQRRAALWQHSVKKARNARSDKIALDRHDVEEALHYPDVHRSVLNEDMAQVANAVTVDGVAEYRGGSPGPGDPAELRVDLSQVPEDVDASTIWEGR